VLYTKGMTTTQETSATDVAELISSKLTENTQQVSAGGVNGGGRFARLRVMIDGVTFIVTVEEA
jgi:DNA gyrase inhibitor GyrI